MALFRKLSHFVSSNRALPGPEALLPSCPRKPCHRRPPRWKGSSCSQSSVDPHIRGLAAFLPASLSPGRIPGLQPPPRHCGECRNHAKHLDENSKMRPTLPKFPNSATGMERARGPAAGPSQPWGIGSFRLRWGRMLQLRPPPCPPLAPFGLFVRLFY